MGWEFNVYETSTLVSTPTRLKFPAGPDMPVGYEIHIVGTGLSFDALTGTLDATTITSIELYDPTFGPAGGARQTISIATGDQTTLAASITSFLQSGLEMLADTGEAWDFETAGVDHLGNAVFDTLGTFVEIELLDAAGALLGYLRFDGEGLTETTLSQTGLIGKFSHLDISRTLVDLHEVTYAPPRSAAAFEYALLSTGMLNPDGTAQGNDEVHYPVMVAGDDTITGHAGTDALDGGAGLDDLDGGLGDDFIFGGTGDDDIHGDLTGDPGVGTNDVLLYLHIGLPPDIGAGVASLGEAANAYVGGVTVSFGAGGDGSVTGNDANDGIGTDTFEGIEQVWGTMNADTLGVDETVADDDIAIFTGMGGADSFTGGAGRDIVIYDNEVFSATILAAVLGGTFTTGVTVNMSNTNRFGQAAGTATDIFGDTDTLTGVDDVHGTLFNDRLIGDAFANELIGKEGADYLDGGLGNDRLFGDAGNDTLTGLSGNDNLFGGAGLDKLAGGRGRDIMEGGAQKDVFDFNLVAETGKTAATRDRITDFQHLVDDIDLSTIDANGSAGGNAAFKLLAAKGAAFTGVKGQLHWFQINAAGTANDKTIIEGDINGDKKADFQIELIGLKTLSAGDFIL